MKPYIPGHAIAMPGESNKTNGVYPGHVSPLRDATHQNTAISSVVVRVPWKWINPAPGGVDLSFTDACMGVTHRPIWFQILDKSFSGPSHTPNHVPALPFLGANHDGWIADRLSEAVMAELTATHQALHAAYGGNNLFAGTATQETAPGESFADRHDYDPYKYGRLLRWMCQDIAKAADDSRLLLFMNFLPGPDEILEDLCQTAARYGVAIGGPDLVEGDDRMATALQNGPYPIYRRLPDWTYRFGSAQWASLERHDPRTIVRVAQELECQMIIWQWAPKVQDPETLRYLAETATLLDTLFAEAIDDQANRELQRAAEALIEATDGLLEAQGAVDRLTRRLGGYR